MKRARNPGPLSAQVKKRVAEITKVKQEYDGDFGTVISTGSTLLDLCISGGRVHGGGLPSGILVEIFGPSGSGKTVLLSEIAGGVQRLGGDVMFQDPEARLNPQFATLFGLELKEGIYSNPNTVTEVFKAVRAWEPQGGDKVIHGIFADSLAALSTDHEMEKEEGDKMGMRRAKEFSEELRKTCRILAKNKYLMVCSNQVRINMDAGPYGQKYITPGGEAIGFYSSLRLRTLKPEKIKEKRMVAGKEVTRTIGVEVQIEVFKSSIWKPFHVAPVTILFDYGIDDIRQNLQFIKDYTKTSVYTFENTPISKSLNESIQFIEDGRLENRLREEVIDLWESIESQFETNRKPKR
jgi:recombination protein RecA